MMHIETEAALAFEPHDHRICATDVLARAEEIARAKGLRLTPVRRRALEILLEAHRALGAYDVLERLSDGGFGKQPPVAYRALDFLVEHGFVHRVRQINAFAACMHPGQDHTPIFLICQCCHRLAEAPGARVRRELRRECSELDFVVEHTSLEAVGFCPACRKGRAQ